MRTRHNSTYASGVVALLWVGLASPLRTEAQSGQFVATGGLVRERLEHTATELPNGTVLITGGLPGSAQTAGSAELYDAATGLFSATGNLITPRYHHTATLLPNGKVLIAGGHILGNYPTATAELYDPGTGTFAPTGNLATARYRHSATLLPSGKVLITGGGSWDGNPTANAELYDPVAGTFSATGGLALARYFHTATPLSNGKVLVAGGAYWTGTGWASTASSELYDPITATFTATGSMITVRSSHAATRLPNGKVLIAAGSQWDGVNGPLTATAELYDPANGTFSTTGGLVEARIGPIATLLPNGKVLTMGGHTRRWDGYVLPSATAELYDPLSGSFTSAPSMITSRGNRSFTATLLSTNGKVLVAAGYTNLPPLTATAAAELYGNPQQCY